MSEVLLLSHRGVQCAVPSSQVVVAEEAVGARHVVELWPARGPVSHPQTEHFVEVLTAVGYRWLRCSGVRLRRLAPSSVWQLSPLLEKALELPHVVGVASVDDALYWLVDSRRFDPGLGGAYSIESAPLTAVILGGDVDTVCLS